MRLPVLSRRSGFTLLEILVVLAIIGLIVGLAIARLHEMHERAKIAATEIFVRAGVKTSLFAYKLDLGDFPSTEEGLAALVTEPSKNADRWHGPYAENASALRDAWGEPFHYAKPGKHNPTSYDVWSSGPDRVSGTDDDIGNWEKPAKGM